jgi:organic radical activating enzyme
MFNLESFCGEPWSQIEINTLGDYKICCLANYNKDYGMAHDKNGNVMNVLTHSIEDAMNSETHKEHRLQLKNNIQVSRCRNCYDSEHSTKDVDGWGDETLKKWGNSKRQRVINVTTKEIPEYVSYDQADKFTLPDGSVTSKVVNLGIRFGNLCNQKCIMCSPEFSSLWYDDYESIYGQGTPVGFGGYKKYNIIKDKHNKNTLNFTKWWEQDIWWERLEEIAPDLRHLYMTGGEPLIVPAMQEILDRLIVKDYAKNIILRFDTNLSVINNKVIEKFKHFKRIDFCVSLDDVDDRYGLIRFPGNYNTVIDNIKILKNNGLDIRYLSCCIGLSSIYSTVRVTEVAEQLGIDTNFRFLEGPDWIDIRSLPKSAKLEIIDFYKNLMHHSKQRTRWYKAVIKLLEKYMDYERVDRLKLFVKTMDKFDAIRGTNWHATLSDIHDLLNRHCPEVLET